MLRSIYPNRQVGRPENSPFLSLQDPSLTISAKPIEVWAGFQPWIVMGEQSGLLTGIAAMEAVSLYTPMKY
jgi:hypothetical protein